MPLRIYMDIGTNESSGGQSSSNIYWQQALGVYNDWLADGYTINKDLLLFPECNGLHNEAAWSRRLPTFFRFALDPWDEVNSLTLKNFPPRLEITSVNSSAGTATLSFLAPRGVNFQLQSGSTPETNEGQRELPPATNLWEAKTLEEILSPGSPRQFWRLRY